MGRRRPPGQKIYTLFSLLDKQTKSFQKEEHYPLLISYLKNSYELNSVRFNRRCFSLLHNGVIKPEHLENFYRTYRLPKHPFFPLFLMIKREYLMERAQKLKEREEYIRSGFNRLPSSVLEFFQRIKELESLYHPAGRTPVYKGNLFPKTKKRADSYGRFTHEEWIDCFDTHLTRLRETYERLPVDRCDRLLSCYILHTVPPSLTFQPDQSTIRKNFRALSKKCHPDAGGDPRVFIKVKWAWDVLAVL